MVRSVQVLSEDYGMLVCPVQVLSRGGWLGVVGEGTLTKWFCPFPPVGVWSVLPRNVNGSLVVWNKWTAGVRWTVLQMNTWLCFEATVQERCMKLIPRAYDRKRHIPRRVASTHSSVPGAPLSYPGGRRVPYPPERTWDQRPAKGPRTWDWGCPHWQTDTYENITYLLYYVTQLVR